MKNVAYFLDNKSFSSVDCSDILSGNPGIGGTENMFYVIATLLSKRENDIKVKLFITAPQLLPQDLDFEIVENLSTCVITAEKGLFDFLIIKHDVHNIYNKTLEKAEGINLKIIIWAHVFICYWELDYYSKLQNIYKIVNVGREALDLYLDHPAYEKSCFIYNCINLSEVESTELIPFCKRQNIVTYIGQLSPFKGFHLLAEAWPQVLRKVPDAQLYIIGSGKLYDKNNVLGPFGFAESMYEQRFLKYLTDTSGNILPNVHFMGVMGKEKTAILTKTKVGVPNPSGITETFCISAVEMQINGAFITTIKAPGFIDTVKNGILYSRRNQLAKTIIKALRLKKNSYTTARKYFQDHFSYECVALEWENLIKNGKVLSENKSVNLNYRYKWLKKFLRALKMRNRFFTNLPYLERILLFIERQTKGRVTYLDSNAK